MYERLLQWKNNDTPDTAILIDGARRVGKSYVAEHFAKAEYKSYILIDFNIAPREVRAIFDENLENLDEFFKKISSYYAVPLHAGETLFIFDEVQEFPRARAAIKYLVADGRYHNYPTLWTAMERAFMEWGAKTSSDMADLRRLNVYWYNSNNLAKRQYGLAI